MSGRRVVSDGPSAGRRARRLPHRGTADVAWRLAWWSLALYPVCLVAAFVIGDGLISLLANNPGDAALWQVLVAAMPALLVFVIPGILAVTLGRRATRLGRADGKVPAIIGATIAIGFVGLNVLSYVVGRVFD
jgi:Na+-driven multidrug efflux pump